MHKNMAHTFHHLPRQLWMTTAIFRSEFIGCLAYNLYQFYITIELYGIFLYGFQRIPLFPFKEYISSIEYMLKPAFIFNWLSHK